MSNYIFKAGDRVSFGGMKGTVTRTDGIIQSHPLNIEWDRGSSGIFTADGRYFAEQTRPVLKLLKKKKRELIEYWIHRDAFSYSNRDWNLREKPPNEDYVRVRITRLSK